MKFEGKVALVTGGSRGIGRDIAIKIASKGAFVNVIYSTRVEEAERTLELIRSLGGDGSVMKCNVADTKEVEETVKAILGERKRVDLLVNNAGIARDSLLMRLKEEDFDRVIGVNLKGVFNCTKSVVKSMIKNRSGRVVNITSVVGEMGNAGQSIYAASKAGIIGFTKSIAREVAQRGVTVNAVSPGFILTEMTETLPENVKGEYLNGIPLGRFGDPEDISNAVLYLCSDEAGYITGQVIGVNGGMYM
jgi:3-oxoacyl-[acyl-carrier protein] reductase